MERNDRMIAIYSRKSKFTGKGESIENQIELCKNYIRSRFGEEAEERCVVYEDEGFSGGDLKRPDFQNMMEAVRQKKIDAIVVYRLDRISRNIGDFAGLIGELSKLDVSFVSIREQFDTNSPTGRAMMFVASVFSQLERETIAERIRDNMHELAKTGRWLGGNTPTGFRSGEVSKVTVDGKTRKSFMLIPIEEEAELVQTIFELYRQTDSLTAVEAELMRRRLTTKQGNHFTRFAIKAILQNPVYMTADGAAYDYFIEKQADVCASKEAFDGNCGIMAYNRTDQEKGKTTKLLPEEEWIIALGKHPGLIPSDLWIQTQRSLERNKMKSYRKPRRNEALLTGLLFCTCGERMYPKLTNRKTPDGDTVYDYVCKMKQRSKRELCKQRNANGNNLDRAILEQLKIITEDNSRFITLLEKYRKEYIGNQDRFSGRIEKLRSEYAKNEKVVEGMMDTLALMAQSKAKLQFLERMEKLVEENREIELQIGELEGLASANALSAAEFDTLRKKLAQFSVCVDSMTVEEKRTAIRSVVHKVVWDGEKVHVVLFGADEGELNLANLSGLELPGSDAKKTPWGEDSK